MTIHTAREERAQLSLSCADVAKKGHKDSVGSNASLSVGLRSPRGLSPTSEQQDPARLITAAVAACLSKRVFSTEH